jgi:alpha-galactosidase
MHQSHLCLTVFCALLIFLCSVSSTAAQTHSIRTASHTVFLYGNLRRFKAELTSRSVEKNLDIITLKLSADAADTLPAGLTLAFSHPIIDLQSNWHPSMMFSRHLRITWQEGFFSNATHNAPLICAHNFNGENRLTFACSDAVNPITVRAGVNEEASSLECKAELFSLHTSPRKDYTLELRIDTRPKKYYAALEECRNWYESFYKPMPVPNLGRLPMYSSWYSFHKALNADTLVMQCKTAKAFGCDAVIIDDGWQTTDARSIYEDCGDWEVKPEIFPDFKKTVSQIHALDMKVLLWFAVPFAGQRSNAAQTFKDKMLYYDWGLRTQVFDVRFPEVREHIISRLEDLTRRYDLDGLKLDFVDMLRSPNRDTKQTANGRDFESVEEATVKLMSDIRTRIEKLKPEVMIEFRQSYISPVMRSCGNLFRAGDCANDALENRVRVVDIRLLSGSTAVHSDMITWNVNEPVEIAAQQITNILFSVPQLSNRFEKIPNAHLEMIRYWMQFWRTHRDVLLDGTFMPEHPELNYPIVAAENKTKKLIAVYENQVVDVSAAPPMLLVVNAKSQKDVVMNVQSALGKRRVSVYDCTGKLIRTEKKNFTKGLHTLAIPASGVAEIGGG